MSVFHSGGCTSTNPIAAPAPIAELPTSLRFPDPSIDVSKIATGEGASLFSFQLGGTGEFLEEIRFGGNTIGFIHFALDQLLMPLRSVEIPVSTDPKLDAVFTLDPGTPAELVIKMHFDFRPFDFDGDGEVENCSGHTAELPICFGVWFEGTEDPVRMAGIFTEFPTDENPGAGQFKVEGILDLKVGVVYDHTDPENKSTELATRTIVDFSRPPGERGSLFENHSLVTQVGPDASSKKLVNLSQGFDTSGNADGRTGFIRYVGQFFETMDINYWSGSIDAQNSDGVGLPPTQFDAQCANILTGTEAPPLICEDLGIDVTGIGFIDFSMDADVNLPPGFPQSPPP